MNHQRRVLASAIVVAVGAACSGAGPDPGTAPQDIAAHVGSALAAADQLMAGDQVSLTERMGSVAELALGGQLAGVQPALAGVTRAFSASPAFTFISPAAIAAVHGRHQEIRRLLAERVLTAENLEREGEGELVYLLGAQSTCRALDGEAHHPDCVRLLQAVPVRARVTTAATGSYRVQFLVGEARIEPLMVQVSATVLNAYLNLPQLKSSSALIAAALGEPDPLPAQMNGQLRVSLATRPDAAELIVYVPYDIDIADATSGVSLRVTSAHELGRVLIFSADAPTGRRSADLSFGRAELVTPWRPGPAGLGGSMRLFLGGLQGRLAYWEGQRHLTALRLTLGTRPSSIEVRGVPILETLFNPSPRDVYEFRLALEPDAQGWLALEVGPRLELQMRWNLGAVAAELPEPPPAHLLDQSYQLNIEGPREDIDRGARLEELPWSTAADRRGLRVARGELSIYASGAPAALDATAGQCLLHRTARPEDHPILGALEVAECPAAVAAPSAN